MASEGRGPDRRLPRSARSSATRIATVRPALEAVVRDDAETLDRHRGIGLDGRDRRLDIEVHLHAIYSPNATGSGAWGEGRRRLVAVSVQEQRPVFGPETVSV